MNRYRIPAEIHEHIRNINIRHDASERYPQSQADYPEEVLLLSEGRKPLDNLHAFPYNSGSGKSDFGSDRRGSVNSLCTSNDSSQRVSDDEEDTKMDIDPPDSK